MNLILARPPIKEAILEVIFSYPKSVDFETIKNYKRTIEVEFPTAIELNSISGNIEVPNSFSTEHIGYVHHSNDKNSSIQTRLNGFAFSVLNQTYKSWELFQPLAFSQLTKFIDFFNPNGISRFSLRFINEITLLPDESMAEYFNFLPNTEKFKNLSITNSFLRVEFFNDEINALGIVTQLIKPPLKPLVNVYLDIDVIINKKNNDFPVNLSFLEEEFKKLRLFKNDLFVSSLTGKAINKFN